ncbi:Protein of unknown function, partial [Gryllus bimaculatus]
MELYERNDVEDSITFEGLTFLAGYVAFRACIFPVKIKFDIYCTFRLSYGFSGLGCADLQLLIEMESNLIQKL